MMKSQNVATLEELIGAARQLHVKYSCACEMAMHILGLKKEDLIDRRERGSSRRADLFKIFGKIAQVLFI